MKLVAAITLSLLILIVGFQVISFARSIYKSQANLSLLEEKLKKTEIDTEALRAELRYLANPSNLEKELRSRFNYRNPEEKMIVIVPRGSSGATTSTP
jgi:cell division protein FtsL